MIETEHETGDAEIVQSSCKMVSQSKAVEGGVGEKQAHFWRSLGRMWTVVPIKLPTPWWVFN